MKSLLFAPLLWSAAADEVPTAQTFEARYVEFRAAFDSLEDSRVLAMVTPDFFSEDVDGNRESAVQLVAYRRDNAATFPERRNRRTTVTQVRSGNDVAFVSQTYEADLVSRDAAGTEDSVHMTAHSDDVWRRKNGVWLMSSTVTRAVEMTAAGKIVYQSQHK